MAGRTSPARSLEAADLALRHVAAPIVAAGVRVAELRVSGGLAADPGLNRAQGGRDRLPGRGPGHRRDGDRRFGHRRRHGIGAFPDFAAGIRAMVRIDERIVPDPDRRAAYDAVYATYVGLYPALRPTFQRLAEAAGGG